jgi:hypothetical protein
MKNSSQPAGHGRCGGKGRNGPCKLPAGHGTSHPGIGRCDHHGGATPTHEISARRVLAERACNELGIPVETTPGAALRDALAHAMGRVIYLRAKEGALGGELVWGEEKRVVRTTHGQGGQPVLEVHQGGRVHVYSRLLMDAEDRLAKIATEMARLGLEQRAVRADEVLIEQFRRVTEGMLARLELTPQQRAMVPEAAATAVRELHAVDSA